MRNVTIPTTNEQKLKDIIRNIHKRKAPGRDGIKNKTIKNNTEANTKLMNVMNHWR